MHDAGCVARYYTLNACSGECFTGGLDNVLHYANLSQGEHNYTVIARDQHGLVGRSEAHFEGEHYYYNSSHISHCNCSMQQLIQIMQGIYM